VDDLLAVAGYQLELIELQESDELLQLLTEKNSLLEFYKTLPDTLVNLKDFFTPHQHVG